MSDIVEKECRRCGLVLPLWMFYADNREKSGRRACCKGCSDKYTRTTRERNRSEKAVYEGIFS